MVWAQLVDVGCGRLGIDIDIDIVITDTARDCAESGRAQVAI
jgi:hypothetical protein